MTCQLTHYACIVDQHVQSFLALEDVFGETSDGLEGAQIQLHADHLLARVA